MGLNSQRFEDIGFAFFGDDWKRPMATVLDVDEKQIAEWIEDPGALPENIETRLKLVGEARVELIQMFLYLVTEAGISREKPTDG